MRSDPALWARIAEYPIGIDGAAFSFAQRLARDNNWTPNFADQVMGEYKRFVYLATISEQQLTPSDQVDQAWHLHLLHTHDYWGRFVETLGAPLHHGPTPGGRAAAADYRCCYERTIARYCEEFGEHPPPSIWPDADTRFSVPLHYQRVDTRRPRQRSRKLLFLTGGSTLAVASAAVAETQNSWITMKTMIAAIVVVTALVIWFVVDSAANHSGGKKKDNGGAGVGGDGGKDGGGKDGGGDSGCGSGCGGCGG